MSEPQISDPVAVAQPNDLAASPGEMVEDPLLGSDSFIDTEKPETESPEHKPATPDSGFGQGVAIAAEPISMLRPEEGSVEAAPKSAPRRRDPEEMSKRPSWLPEDWTIDLRVRSSGATAGLIDRYFLGPSGQPRLRSKNEVMSFLENGSSKKTGSSKKRKATSEADAEPLESPVTSPKRSSQKGKKGKKSDDVPESPVSSQKKSSKKIKKAKNVPKKSDDVPAKSDDSPTKSDDVLAKSDDVPAKSDDVPAKSDDVPTKSDDVPAKSDDVPAKSDGVPAKSDDGPEKSEDDGAPVKSDSVPEKFEDIPMEFEDVQGKSEDVGSDE